ncbi:MAG: NifU family protein [Bacteroidia bacterium]
MGLLVFDPYLCADGSVDAVFPYTYAFTLPMRQVNMHIEGVPNPNAMKFVLENGLLAEEAYEFRSMAEAEYSPLARKLLMLRYVERVLIFYNHVTILKQEQGSPEWQDILPGLRAIIQGHLEANEPVLYIGVEKLAHRNDGDTIESLIRQVLNQRVRPAAQEDGGDILFDSFDNGTLNLSMHGACYHCPHAGQTLKQGVELLMTSLFPEVKRVTATSNGQH